MSTKLLEITLISAQGLKLPQSPRSAQTHAITWVDPAYKLLTRTDRTGGTDPAWNDRFVFRVPAEFLVPDSSGAVIIEIYCAGGWYGKGKESLVGSVRFLIGSERLLEKAANSPSFAALGIRRPSGRITGVLNIGAVLLEKVSRTVSEALVRSPAVGYRDLMQRPAMRDRTNMEERETSTERREKPVPVILEGEEEEEDDEREDSVRGVVFCGPCLLRVPRKVCFEERENFKVQVPARNSVSKR